MIGIALRAACVRRCVLARLRAAGRRAAEDVGQVVVLTTMMMMAVVFGMGALAIDASRWYIDHHQAQVAADAGALAAAQDVAFSSSSVTSDAQAMAAANAPNGSASVTNPYSGNSADVRVAVTVTDSESFSSFFVKGAPRQTASAVAQGSIIADGRFGTPNVCLGSGANWGCNIATGGTLGAWTVTQHNLDAMECNWHQGGEPGDVLYIAPPSGDPCNATPDEAQSAWTANSSSVWVIDLNGEWTGCNGSGNSCTTSPDATIQQTVTTIPGETYDLEFQLSDNPTLGLRPSPNTADTMSVSITDGTTATSDIASGVTTAFTAPSEVEPNPNTWVGETVPFTAQSTSTKLSFSSTTGNGCKSNNVSCPDNAGPVITDVQTAPLLIQ